MELTEPVSRSSFTVQWNNVDATFSGSLQAGFPGHEVRAEREPKHTFVSVSYTMSVSFSNTSVMSENYIEKCLKQSFILIEATNKWKLLLD